MIRGKLKIILILFIILITSLCVGSVSAIDDSNVDDSILNEEINILDEESMNIDDNYEDTFLSSNDLSEENICNDDTENNSEKDNFKSANEQYVSNSDELNEAIKNGGTIKFSSDIRPNDTINITIDGTILDGMGYNLIGNQVYDSNTGSYAGGNLSSIIVSASNVTIKNLKICNNTVTKKYNSKIAGGAIYWQGENGTLTNCYFYNDKVEYHTSGGECHGGAIYWQGVKGTVTDCNFSYCSSLGDFGKTYGYGGAIDWEGENGTITNCTFNHCQGERGGAIYWYPANGTIHNSSFYYNTARLAGAVYFSSRYGNITSCTFGRNNCTEYGGALAVENWNIGLRNCTFSYNCANGEETNGGAVSWNAMYGNLTNCTFTRNYALSTNESATCLGGAVYWGGSSGNLTNCSFHWNNATAAKNISNACGGAIYWKYDYGKMSDLYFNTNRIYAKPNTYYTYTENNIYCSEDISRTTYTPDISSLTYDTLSLSDFAPNTTTVTIGYIKCPVSGSTIYISNLTQLKNYTVSFKFSNSTFRNMNISATFPITLAAKMTVNSISYGNTATINLTLRDKYINSVEVYVNGILHSVSVSNGNGLLSLPLLEVGNYNVSLKDYACDNKSFSVSKSNIKISSTTSNIDYGDTKQITVNSGNINLPLITLLVNDVKYNVSLSGGSGSIYLYNLSGGNYSVSVDNLDSIHYTSSIYRFIVNQVKPLLDVYPIDNHTYGEKTIIKFYMYPAVNDFVSVQIGNDTFEAVVKDGNCEFTVPKILDVGNYTANIKFSGNQNLKSASKSIKFNITKDTLSISFDKSNVVYLDKVNIILSKKINGTLSFLINGATYSIKITDGKGALPSFNAGQYGIIVSDASNYTVNYLKDKLTISTQNYNFIESILTVNKINTKVSFVIEYDKNYDIINVWLSDAKNNMLSSRWVYVTDERDGWSHKLYTGFDGSDYKNITKLVMGNHPITVRYDGDENHNSVSTTFEVTVNKLKTIMVDNKLTYYVGVKNKYLKITLKDQNQKIIKNQKVTLTVNKKSYTATTDKNGVATFKNFNIQKAGTYKATVKYAGIYNYYGTSLSTKIVVYKKASTLTVPKKTFKKAVKTKKLTVTLKSGKTVLKKKVIKVTVNKKTYKVKTNNKGVATVKLKLTKKGTYTVVTKFAGDSTYKAATRKSKVVIK